MRIVDDSGKEVDDTGRRWRRGSQPTFSPDGRRLIAALGNGDVSNLWLHDLVSPNWTRLTSDHGLFPVWAPDGKRVAFSRAHGGDLGIYVQPAEPAEARLLLYSPGVEAVTDWNSATDRILYYRIETDERRRDLWYLEPDGQGGYAPKMFLSEPFNQRSGAFSPDGGWVAYVSDQEGPDEVYLRKFPEGTPVHKVSRRGGDAPRWRRDGKELFYLEGQALMAVEVNLDERGFIRAAAAAFLRSRLPRRPAVSPLRPGPGRPHFRRHIAFTRSSCLAGGHPRGRELVRRVPRPRAGLIRVAQGSRTPAAFSAPHDLRTVTENVWHAAPVAPVKARLSPDLRHTLPPAGPIPVA